MYTSLVVKSSYQRVYKTASCPIRRVSTPTARCSLSPLLSPPSKHVQGSYSVCFSRKAVNRFIRVSSSTKTDSSNTNRQGFKRPSRFFFHNSWRGASPPRSRMQIYCLKSAYSGSVEQEEWENASLQNECTDLL